MAGLIYVSNRQGKLLRISGVRGTQHPAVARHGPAGTRTTVPTAFPVPRAMTRYPTSFGCRWSPLSYAGAISSGSRGSAKALVARQPREQRTGPSRRFRPCRRSAGSSGVGR